MVDIDEMCVKLRNFNGMQLSLTLCSGRDRQSWLVKLREKNNISSRCAIVTYSLEGELVVDKVC